MGLQLDTTAYVLYVQLGMRSRTMNLTIGHIITLTTSISVSVKHQTGVCLSVCLYV